ncbi:protein rep [Microbacterium panaciterrae]
MKAAGGPARFTGVQTCGSVWSCACCGSRIREHRSGEVQDAAAWWEKQGGQFLFLTLTVRHWAEDSLTRTMDALTHAFTATINGAPWKRFTRRHGIRHWIKAQEVTLGWQNGWHAHLHVLLFVDLPGAVADAREDAARAWAEVDAAAPRVRGVKIAKAKRRDAEVAEAARIAKQGIGRERERELHSWLYERWAAMVVKHGGRRPSKRRGVDIRSVRHGNVVALYVSKLQEGDREKRGWKVGSEMTRQDLKKGRQDSLVPLELLDLDGLSEDERDRNRAYWIEYAASTSGRRSMTWSRGLKEAAGIAEVDDDEIAEAEAEEVEDERVIVIRAAHWRSVRDDPDVLARILYLVEEDRVEDVGELVPFEWPPPLN